MYVTDNAVVADSANKTTFMTNISSIDVNFRIIHWHHLLDIDFRVHFNSLDSDSAKKEQSLRYVIKSS